MKNGVPEGKGELVHDGRSLFTGSWTDGSTVTESLEMALSKGLSPSELHELYLDRDQYSVRLVSPSAENGPLEHTIRTPRKHPYTTT